MYVGEQEIVGEGKSYQILMAEWCWRTGLISMLVQDDNSLCDVRISYNVE